MLTFIKKAGKNHNRYILGLYQCDCGNTCIYPMSSIPKIDHQSCGCKKQKKCGKDKRFIDPNGITMKRCYDCKLFKPLQIAFNKSRSDHDGYEDQCKACKSIKGKKIYQRGLAFTDGYKTAPCADCHKIFDPISMDFDHVRGEKINGVSQLLMKSLEVIWAEIQKCEIVCANCHRVRTLNRKIHIIPQTNKQKDVIKRRNNGMIFIDGYRSIPCFDCHILYNITSMEFDHIRGEKHADVSDLYSYSKEVILVEIQKCEVVCVNCHRVRERDRRRLKKSNHNT